MALIIRKLADRTAPEPDAGDAWPLRGVDVIGDAPAEHWFTPDFVIEAVSDGWMTVDVDHITIALVDGSELVYRIVSRPGRHDDPDDPAGYVVVNAYVCELEA